MFESITQFVGMLLILGFTAWGVAGLIASLGAAKRSRLRTWWRGSHYGSVGEPNSGPILRPGPEQNEAR